MVPNLTINVTPHLVNIADTWYNVILVKDKVSCVVTFLTSLTKFIHLFVSIQQHDYDHALF